MHHDLHPMMTHDGSKRCSACGMIFRGDALIQAIAEATSCPGAKRDEVSRAEYAGLLGIRDLARLIVDGWDHGYPLSDDTASEGELVDRLRDTLRALEAER